MFFRFGGLGTMSASNNTRLINGLMLTQTGLRIVASESHVFPVFFGGGYRLVSPRLGDSEGDWGMDVGGGYEYHFRIWRRISPFVGFQLGVGISDPTGEENLVLGVGFGPTMGIEYYIADRVSLIAQYLLNFQVELVPSDEFAAFSVNTLAGGALNLVFYF